MDYKKIFLYAAFMVVMIALWNAWQIDHPQQLPEDQQIQPLSAPLSDVPVTPLSETKLSPSLSINKGNNGNDIDTSRWVHVKTDVLDVMIDTKGGNVVQAQLLKYLVSLKDKNPVQILSESPLYVAQSGLTGPNGPDKQSGQVHYSVQKQNYSLLPRQNQLNVDLTWVSPTGVIVTKTFIFTKDNYAIKVGYHIDNRSTEVWRGNFYTQVKRKNIDESSGSLFKLHTFTGAAISTQDIPYKKLSYKKLAEENVNQSVIGGWLALQQRYFLTAWAPDQTQNNHYYSQISHDVYITLGVMGPEIQVKPRSAATIQAALYIGPEIADRLKNVAPHLELTVDYGWLWFLSVIIFWVMKHIYSVVGNWGWSIILVTCLIKLLFFKLSETSYRSMGSMKKLAPRLQALKEQHGNDRQKMSQATMELYKREKVNPLGGCLPILVQIPVFIALYYVLVESVQLRQAPFVLWIHDLSAKDPYYILPILMGISMFLQQKLNPAPPDPVQARVMMFLPVMFTVFFMSFPSGLVLYWLVNNCLSVMQQWYIMRRLEKTEARYKK